MGSQEILKQYNALKNQYDAVNYDSILKAQLEKDAANKKADVDTFSSGYDSQINNTQAFYDKKIADEKIAYDSEYQKNAVQKLINEKKIAETNANLGLTDSGLNRTQQTAAQLGYANQKGRIDLARQSALDNLTLAMTDAITTLQNQKASGIRDIENNWKSYSENQAQNTYNAQLNSIAGQLSDMGDQYVDAVKAEADAAAEVQKAAIEAAGKKTNVSYGAGGTSTGGYIVSSKTGTLSRDYMGSLKDNGVSTVYSYDEDGGIKSVTYTDSNSGISATFDVGVNPYYGDMHEDLRNEDGEYDPSRAFSNGYQPNNIKGEKLFATKYDKVEVYDGSPQTVFKTKSNDKLWIWDAARNDYIDYREFMGVKDWDAGDWEGYFATVRNIDGRAAAEEELLFYSNNGLLPDDMMYFARIGAQGSFGH